MPPTLHACAHHVWSPLLLGDPLRCCLQPPLPTSTRNSRQPPALPLPLPRPTPLSLEPLLLVLFNVGHLKIPGHLQEGGWECGGSGGRRGSGFGGAAALTSGELCTANLLLQYIKHKNSRRTLKGCKAQGQSTVATGGLLPAAAGGQVGLALSAHLILGRPDGPIRFYGLPGMRHHEAARQERDV